MNSLKVAPKCVENVLAEQIRNKCLGQLESTLMLSQLAQHCWKLQMNAYLIQTNSNEPNNRQIPGNSVILCCQTHKLPKWLANAYGIMICAIAYNNRP